MDVLKMKAGREMDFLIAKQVMGWTYRDDNPEGFSCPRFDNPGWWHSPEWQNDEWECAACLIEDDAGSMPHWSTELEDVKYVVARLQKQAWYLILTWHRHDSMAEFRSPVLDIWKGAWGETPQHAICRAALLLRRP